MAPTRSAPGGSAARRTGRAPACEGTRALAGIEPQVAGAEVSAVGIAVLAVAIQIDLGQNDARYARAGSHQVLDFRRYRAPGGAPPLDVHHHVIGQLCQATKSGRAPGWTRRCKSGEISGV